MKRRYRSKLKGPLPVGLKSGSISVASKGYFNVEGDDLNSSDLLTKVRTKQVELIEETVEVEVKSDPPPPPEPEPEVTPENVPDGGSEDPDDVIGDEKDDDSLTSSSEMVESEDDETGSDDAKSTDEPNRSKKQRKKARGGRGKTKGKGISG